MGHIRANETVFWVHWESERKRTHPHAVSYIDRVPSVDTGELHCFHPAAVLPHRQDPGLPHAHFPGMHTVCFLVYLYI